MSFFFLGYVLILILFIIENNIDSVEWCTNNVCVKLLRLSKYLFSIFWRLIEISFFYFKVQNCYSRSSKIIEMFSTNLKMIL